jgi:hypothetical protein
MKKVFRISCRSACLGALCVGMKLLLQRSSARLERARTGGTLG